MPDRIQLHRTAGWRKPPGAVVVARPSKWGNPFRYRHPSGLVRYRPETPDQIDYEGRISVHGTRHDWYGPDGSIVEYWVRYATRAELVELFRATLLDPTPSMRMTLPSAGGRMAHCTPEEIRTALAGRDLACWCPLVDERGNRVPCHADVLLSIAAGTGAEATQLRAEGETGDA